MSESIDLYGLAFEATSSDGDTVYVSQDAVVFEFPKPHQKETILTEDQVSSDDVISLYEIDFGDGPSETLTTAVSKEKVPAPVSILESDPVVQKERVKRPVVLPPAAHDFARLAIQTVMEASDRPHFPLKQVVDLLGGSLPKREAWELKQALKQSDQLDYLGDEAFAIRDRIDAETYWPGELNQELINTLHTRVVEAMEASMLTKFSIGKVMGVVRGTGNYLIPDEFDALVAQLYLDPNLKIIDTDGFSLLSVEVDDGAKFEKMMRGTKDKLISTDEKRAINRLYPNKGYKGILVRAMKKKRIFNNLTRGPRAVHPSKILEYPKNQLRGSRIMKPAPKRQFTSTAQLAGGNTQQSARKQGRGHGKKVTFEQMVAQLNKPADSKE